MQNVEFQEIEEDGGFDSSDVYRLILRRFVDGFAATNSHHATTNASDHHITNPPPPVPCIDHCTMCGSTKRRSPSSSPLQEPPSKKTTLQPSSSTAIVVEGGNHVHGFTKLPLPATPRIVSSSTASDPTLLNSVLRRCISDPINSPGTNNFGARNTPENVNFNVNVSATTPSPEKSSLTQSPPSLHRSMSDPTQSTLPPPEAKISARNSSEMGTDSIREQSHTAKKLNKMKDRLKEMSQLCNEVLREVEKDNGSEDSNNIPKLQDEPETETEEAVCVERNGELLIIRFKCPCSKGYQILLSGHYCCYKLI